MSAEHKPQREPSGTAHVPITAEFTPSNQHSRDAKTIRRVLMGEWAKNASRLQALQSLDNLEEQLEAARREAERAEEYALDRDEVAQKFEEQMEAAQSALREIASYTSSRNINDDFGKFANDRIQEMALLALSASSPATSRCIEIEITGDGSGVALPPIVEGLSAPRTWNPSGGAGVSSPASSSDDAAGAEESSPAKGHPMLGVSEMHTDSFQEGEHGG